MRLAWTFVTAVCLSSFAAAGTPWFTQDPGTLKKGMWRVEEHVLYSPTDSALVDGDKVPLTSVREFKSLTVHTRVRYGVRDDVTVFMDVPWVFREMTSTTGVTTRNDDLGDLFFLVKGKYYDNKEKQEKRAFSLSLKTHTGEFSGLPAGLATGTGTEDFTISHLWQKGMGRTTWYASAGYTFPGQRPDLLRDPGDVAFANLALTHPVITHHTYFVGEVNLAHRRKAHDVSGEVPDSDSTILYLSPGLQCYHPQADGRSLQLEAGVQIPVLMNGNAPSIPDYTFYGGGYVVF